MKLLTFSSISCLVYFVSVLALLSALTKILSLLIRKNQCMYMYSWMFFIAFSPLDIDVYVMGFMITEDMEHIWQVYNIHAPYEKCPLLRPCFTSAWIVLTYGFKVIRSQIRAWSGTWSHLLQGHQIELFGVEMLRMKKPREYQSIRAWNCLQGLSDSIHYWLYVPSIFKG